MQKIEENVQKDKRCKTVYAQLGKKQQIIVFSFFQHLCLSITLNII